MTDITDAKRSPFMVLRLNDPFLCLALADPRSEHSIWPLHERQWKPRQR